MEPNNHILSRTGAEHEHRNHLERGVTTTLPPATDYLTAARQMRADARAFMAIAAHVETQPRYLTFGPALAERMRVAYEQLADVFTLASEQAEEIAAGIPLCCEQVAS